MILMRKAEFSVDLKTVYIMFNLTLKSLYFLDKHKSFMDSTT